MVYITKIIKVWIVQELKIIIEKISLFYRYSLMIGHTDQEVGSKDVKFL